MIRTDSRATAWAYRAASVLLLLVLTSACGSKHPAPARIQVPPRLDLHSYGRVALVLFTVERAKGSLDEFATRRFSEEVLAAQPGIEVLELGAVDSVRRRVGEAEFGAKTAKAVGAAHQVPVIFVGHLKMSDVTPSGGLHGLSLPHVEATVSAELTVALFTAGSGGTVWRSSGVATRKVAGLSLVGGEPVFSAKNPNQAYARMVADLVAYVTRDLRPTWQ